MAANRLQHTGQVHPPRPDDLALTAPQLAPRLLGARIVAGDVTLELTEVEAYGGVDDPAAHAFGGPRPANRHLFGPPGTLYCYLSHGIHICANITCGPTGQAVLFRAGRIISGAGIVAARRAGRPPDRWASGPGNLGQALGWTLSDSGTVFGSPGLTLLLPDQPRPAAHGPRVGVSVAYQRPWRFWIPGDPTVSAYRRSPRVQPGRQDW